MSHPSFRHAVVAGASMAGLLAARALAERFERVTLIERDALPRRAEARRGVPQANHLHILLPGGQAALERLLPGIAAELAAEGAVGVRVGRELAWHNEGAWRLRHDSELRVLALSRPLLEAHVAQRVRALPNVAIREGVRLQGLVVGAEGALAGVRVQGLAEEVLEADLVVDATGRGSSVPERLRQMGHGEVPTERIPVQVNYASAFFAKAPRGPDWRALIVGDRAAGRFGLMFPVEGERWIVTLGTLFEQPVPVDRAEMLAFARTLPVPDLHDVLRDLDPVSEVVRYRYPGSQRRRYDRTGRLPAGLLAVGDALASFNPLYGQGMTVAALEAEALGRWLEAAAREGATAGMQARWFREAGRIADAAWTGVAVEDFRLPELAGQAPRSLRPLQWYMARVQAATCRSAVVADAFYRVIGFVEPPGALFRPRVAAEVLLGRGPKPGRSPAPGRARTGGWGRPTPNP
ncbi:monooxygenase, FAD-binding protein [Rubellimicrobium mesophilum DSM 19309]|uniref:Monooxygenase, FAD-binding protein n=1 Tax=Rubellimicrobium mesophilum DSM 19309 TaxID=442562 RepID=A0A017HB82_9RHOB|nr:FAD-dependent monooxygenase [Rubellimicrobium mesophilum]EYD71545.1 monooxygenase, FAD-binding protein [Rubellimicrobium mesophilum DSM 19309]